MWAGYLEIKNLWVREDLRGQGFGRLLLLAAYEEMRDWHAKQLARWGRDSSKNELELKAAVQRLVQLYGETARPDKASEWRHKLQ